MSSALLLLAIITAAIQDPPDTERIDRLVDVLNRAQNEPEMRWTAAVRDLVGIGKPAVPALAHALDDSLNPYGRRVQAFTLRAIGDPRAVPALIRAIPGTLLPPGSDMGLTVADPDLMKFMQKHDLDEEDARAWFGLGRPVREVFGALHALTGHKFPEDEELFHVFLDGGVAQRRACRALYRQAAERWAAWWEENAARFTDDPAYATVNLPAAPEEPPLPGTGALVPTGPTVKASGGYSGIILGPTQDLPHYATFLDLDTGRSLRWPADLPAEEAATEAEVAAWATRRGFDLRGVEVKPAGADESFYALRSLGLRVWRLDDGAYDTIEGDLRAGKAPNLSRPAGPLLFPTDPATGEITPDAKATFLVITREGSAAVLRLTGQIRELFRQEDLGRPVDDELRRGFSRGIRLEYKLLYEAVGEARPMP
jgi:hypothetical protein